MYKTINGYTKESMIDKVTKEFKGKAISASSEFCEYLTKSGKKCAVGIFIPDGHNAQGSGDPYLHLITIYPELREKMPLPTRGMMIFQKTHDNMNATFTKKEQLEYLINFISENVE